MLLLLLGGLVTDHPFFVGLQAHPEFCTRPLNPSPPFLGFVAASCGVSILEAQIESQLKTFKPPHPEESMVAESELVNGVVEETSITEGRERALKASDGR